MSRSRPALPPARRRVLARLLALTVGAAVLVLATAWPSFAHVTVSSPDASPGGFGKLVFRAPTESATASTVGLTVTLPKDRPFALVSAKPLTGWTITQTERRLASPVEADGFTLSKVVSSVTWTAGPGAGVKPGEFEEFELSVGPFPHGSSSLAMPATQTYSDGTVVRWDEPTVAGQDEPEHPAPVLAVASHSTTAGRPASSGASAGSDGHDARATWLGGAALVVALLALATALLRGRTRASSA